MIIPPAISRKHVDVELYVKATGDRVRDIVARFCADQGFAFLGRTKELSSLAEKLEGGRYSKWSEVDDLYACAVIIPTLTEEAIVLDCLGKNFDLVTLKQRGSSRKDPDVFRFDATRFIGTLKDPAQSYSKITSIPFEIQIRTAFEHAWSVSTHALAYKGGSVDWRYKRLAAQLRASIEQLDQLVLGFQSWSGLIKEQSWHYVDDQRMLVDRFSAWVGDGTISDHMVPSSWVRFSENLYAFISSVMKRDKAKGHQKNVQVALSAIESELTSLDAENMPRSISLLQLCIGAMCKAGVVGKGDGNYVVIATDELHSLYPQVIQANLPMFDFEFADQAN